MNELKKKILIVEDEAIAALALEDIVVRFGYQVTISAASGEDALSEIEKNQPDLVLLDIHIHGPIDGLTVARHAYNLKIPIVFISGYSDAKTRKKAAGFKPVAYLVKPVDHGQLKSIIASVIG